MLILPDKNIARGKILFPQKTGEWRQPSQRSAFSGIENVTKFRLTARLHDGHIAWRGWFADRNDADAFLFALASGSLLYEKELWRLPTPAWHPNRVPFGLYDFATVSFLTASPGSNQTWTSPSDWNNSNNTIEALGGGASGAATGTGEETTGGGAGQYAKIANFFVLVPGTTFATYNIGNLGAAVATTGSGTNGNPGTVTYFNAISDPGAGSDNTKCSAKPGLGGAWAHRATVNGGLGGTGGWGETLNNGGRGGNCTSTADFTSTGGGGAAGPNGAGNQGVDRATGGGSNGGSGDAGSGGAAGTGVTSSTPGGAGGAGTEWDATHGSGGGGGAASDTAGGLNPFGGAAGNYGAGSGAAVAKAGLTGTSGTPSQGIIVITYTPGGATTNKTLALTQTKATIFVANARRGKTTAVIQGKIFASARLPGRTIPLTQAKKLVMARGTNRTILLSQGKIFAARRASAKTVAFMQNKKFTAVNTVRRGIAFTQTKTTAFVKTVNKTRAITQGKIFAVGRSAAKTISIVQNKLAAFRRRNMTAAAIVQGKIAASTRVPGKLVLLTQGKILTLGRFIAKTITFLQSKAFVVGRGISRSIAITQAKRFIVAKLFLKILLLTQGKVAALTAALVNLRQPVKVITIDAAYGSGDVTRIFQGRPTNPIYTTDTATLLISSTEIVGMNNAIIIQITRPDGSVFTRQYPYAWAGEIDTWTPQGRYYSGTYAVTQFGPGELNQVGYWTCELIFGTFHGETGQFYIGAPP